MNTTTKAEYYAEQLIQGRTEELEKHIIGMAVDVAVDDGDCLLLFDDDSWIDMRAETPITGSLGRWKSSK